MDFDATQNIFIESDNLEALKILQKSYAGKIKMIYIDPPYNTGNDFIYHDDFSQSKKDYEIATGDRDMNGQLLKSFKKNSKDNGHYHSNWLNMMLPRLHLAHTLLSDDGVIFISIDDNEQAQLKLLCDEIFGGENCIANIAVEISKTQGMKVKSAKSGDLVKNHEYILVYSKNQEKALEFRQPLYDKADVWDNHFNCVIVKEGGIYKKLSIDDYVKENNPEVYDLFVKFDLLKSNKINSSSIEIGISINQSIRNYFYKSIADIIYQEMACSISVPCDVMNKLKLGGIISYEKYLLNLSSGNKLRQYQSLKETLQKNNEYLSEYGRVTVRGALWKGFYSDMMNVAKEGDMEYKNGKKPVRLIKQLLFWLNRNNAIILDFFAGSATTAHAVMQLNAEDDGNRQFIMVQLPELTDEKSEAHKAGFKTISEISKERIRRAGAKIKAENPDKNIDTGFKVFKLADSNFKAWQIDDDDIAKQLEMYIDPLKDNVNEMDIIYELLLKMGLKLTADIKFEKGVYWLTCENKSYAIVLNSLSQDEFHAIIAKKPAKTVVLDKAFLNDSEKSNMILQFKDAGLNFESI
ncbi:Type III restriction-modification system methylation subunit [Moraxella catarrhalis]|uniref:site-specific DNA-methyltransferase n=1 Tax=Moraxella catarrhalis TaxID=480 RepID=UPI0007E64D4A|nr:site-specific DNA-methyltransferase [Moraxella catarrhalis]OAV34576.1 Type III restriction-modification system methylation subunit [Moraxella catarrhalis]